MMKVVIFDFDGTLANSFPWFVKRINYVAGLMRFNKIESEDIPRLREMDVAQILHYLNIPFWKIPLVVLYMRRLMGRECAEIYLFDEVPLLLKRLNEQYQVNIVILSSNSQKNVQRILRESAKYIDFYYCGAGLKSKAKHFKQLKKKFFNAQLISIGDELRDSQAARECGIRHLNVSWGYGSRDSFGEDEIIDDFIQLEERILRQLNIKD